MVHGQHQSFVPRTRLGFIQCLAISSFSQSWIFGCCRIISLSACHFAQSFILSLLNCSARKIDPRVNSIVNAMLLLRIVFARKPIAHIFATSCCDFGQNSI
ncbi:hypothetical protein QWA68_008055 [Fusarium oxysporum]|nr:hypothetical protein QWA68_008055 [Fusarium oxysporum]